MLIPMHEKASCVGNGKAAGEDDGQHKEEACLAMKHKNFCTGHTTLTMARALPFLGNFSNKGLPEQHFKREKYFSNSS